MAIKIVIFKLKNEDLGAKLGPKSLLQVYKNESCFGGFSGTLLAKNLGRYEVSCHDSICDPAPPTSFKARYVILKACKKTE